MTVKKSSRKLLLIIPAVLALVGLVAYIYQLINGLQITGMSNVNSWGLYIASFMLFVGLSAGGLIVASSATVFNVPKLKKVAKPAVILSTVCISVAAVFILVDLGGIHKIWRLLTGPNFISPLLWDIVVISTYLIINILYLIFMQKPDQNKKKLTVLSYIALPTAVLVHAVTAWIFGLQIAKSWYTAIMAPIFIASALDSGLALLIVSLLILNALNIHRLPDDILKLLSKLLVVFVLVDFFLIMCEILTMAYPLDGLSEPLATILVGQSAPYFWLEMIVGVLLPVILLIISQFQGNNKPLIAIASVFIVLGVFCKRMWILLTGFANVNVFGAPGVVQGSIENVGSGIIANWAMQGYYMATIFEILIFIGVISAGILVFAFLVNKLVVPEKVLD